MSKVTMPEPVVEFRVDQMGIDHDHLFTDEITHLDAGHYKAITTTQAEAYAEARVREAQQWISVETLLPPDDGKEVLAIHSDGEVEIVYGHLILETHCDMAYTHWMPMPDHPTVE